MNTHPAIIVPAFSRPDSLARLLASIAVSKYPATGISLIISLDGGAADEVRDVARSFRFEHGTVDVVEHTRNLGLREHILWCGDQSERHGAVLVLEDDLVVDPWFYDFAENAMKVYGNEPTIGGIALYAPGFSEFADLPFEPVATDASVYLMQSPCSWGQLWTHLHWREFRAWYSGHSSGDLSRVRGLPATVRDWPETSWKKYFAAYLVLSDRYFVYPYRSYATNCAETGGQHIRSGTDRFQVPLGCPWRCREALDFPPVASIHTRYDAFMEAELLVEFEGLPVPLRDMATDIYGIKPIELLTEAKYCLTSRTVGRPIARYPLRFRPWESNLHFPGGTERGSSLSLCESRQLVDQGWIDGVTQKWRISCYFMNSRIGSRKLPGLLLGEITGFVSRRLAAAALWKKRKKSVASFHA